MSYIGVQPTAGQYRKLDNISSGFNGSTTSFTTSVSGTNVTAGTAQQLLVSLGGVIQQPDTDYTVSTNTITFTTAPTSGLTFFAVLMGDALNTVTTSDGAITTAKLAGNLSVGLAAGTASAPSLYFTGDTNTGVYSLGADQVAISTGGTGRLFVDASGRVGIGTSSPGAKLQVNQNTDSATPFAVVSASASTTLTTDYATIYLQNTNTTNNNYNTLGFVNDQGAYSASIHGIYTDHTSGSQSGAIAFATRNAGTYGEKLRITAAGNVGIGTTSPTNKFVVASSGVGYEIDQSSIGNTNLLLSYDRGASAYRAVANYYGGTYSWNDSGNERARIDSSGRLLVGTSTTFDQNAPLQVNSSTGYSANLYVFGADNSQVNIGSARGTVASPTTLGSTDTIGGVYFRGHDGTSFKTGAQILAQIDDITPSSDLPSRLVFSTTADGASSPTERLRINSSGNIGIGNSVATPGSYSNTGSSFGADGYIIASRQDANIIYVNRKGSDGQLIEFAQDGVPEGTISVSGTTVSYNGAHLSRWSQLPSGAERTEILRGSVLSNIDEMCEWGDEDNEQLNRMKVSDVEGDKNVSGVFQSWDDDDDTYTNDFYCAMTGDFIIRIGAGVTVERGDLLVSAGDGTAKPQDDDIIRSKTIAKVTSTNVSCTYDDGSYCVPCVLMAC